MHLLYLFQSLWPSSVEVITTIYKKVELSTREASLLTEILPCVIHFCIGFAWLWSPCPTHGAKLCTTKLLSFAASFWNPYRKHHRMSPPKIICFIDILLILRRLQFFFNFFKTFEEILISNLIKTGEMRPQHVSSFAHLVNSLVSH